MDKELEGLFERLNEQLDRLANCCGCNIFPINNAVQDISDYLNANPECTNTYHGPEGYDCCN